MNKFPVNHKRPLSTARPLYRNDVGELNNTGCPLFQVFKGENNNTKEFQ